MPRVYWGLPVGVFLGVFLVFSAYAAKKTVVLQAAAIDLTVGYFAEDPLPRSLKALLDDFQAREPGVSIRLLRLETQARPALLNFARRRDFASLSVPPGGGKLMGQVMPGAKVFGGAERLSADLRVGLGEDPGRWVNLPIAYSTPVLFYNKQAFRVAGLNPDEPPETWAAMQVVLEKLQDAGYACPYTTAWPSWIHVDNLSALSGVPVATDRGRLVFNHLPGVKHLAMLATWQKSGYFHLFGPRDEAESHFATGECAMVTTDSVAHLAFQEAQGVELGVAPLPHHDDLWGGRRHTVADGASLWLGPGYSSASYQAVAKLIAFVLRSDKQAQWVGHSGFLPLTHAAHASAVRQGLLLRDTERTLSVAYASLRGSGGSDPFRVSAIEPLRVIVEEELASVWAGRQSAKEALDAAVSRGNAWLGSQRATQRSLAF